VERLIVKRPQEINVCGVAGTPLHLSARNEHIKVVQLLLAHGADINSDNSASPDIALVKRQHFMIAKWFCFVLFFFFFFFESIYIPAYSSANKPGRSYEPLHLRNVILRGAPSQKMEKREHSKLK
jgi:ankyrin repeat protein